VRQEVNILNRLKGTACETIESVPRRNLVPAAVNRLKGTACETIESVPRRKLVPAAVKWQQETAWELCEEAAALDAYGPEEHVAACTPDQYCNCV
jgi:hypothetical protein